MGEKGIFRFANLAVQDIAEIDGATHKEGHQHRNGTDHRQEGLPIAHAGFGTELIGPVRLVATLKNNVAPFL